MDTNIPSGLTTQEVQERIAAGKVNAFKDDNTKPLYSIVLANIIDLPNFIIFISIALLVVYQQFQDALLISLVAVVNTIISVAQEVQARNLLKKLSVLQQENVIVIRNGKETSIPPSQIVEDDVIKLESGKYLYVDGELQQQDEILLDESILTGESDYLKKQAGDKMLSGSFVVAGKGYYQARNVGADSFVNSITREAKRYVNYLSPLESQVNTILKVLTYVTLITIGIVLLLNLVSLHNDKADIIRSVVSIINSMVPQGIVLTLTLAFTLGALRMVRKHILVQKASTVETLAGVNVLCMDKTGTITKNDLELIDLIPYGSDSEQEAAKTLLAVFCNLTMEKNKTILAITEKLKTVHWDQSQTKVSEQLPFTSRAKMSGVDFTLADKRVQILLGSLDSLEPFLDVDNIADLRERDQTFASMGRRNVVSIYRQLADTDGTKLSETSPAYQPLAFLSLEDQLRPGARQIITNFTSQGIRVAIISGDNAETLKALLRNLGSVPLHNVITGKDLQSLDNDKKFAVAVMQNDVFARVTPEQKVEIIKALQQHYQYVAMVGDGVNDALAIKQANLGIALGNGANVTKNIADVILLDNDLNKLADVMSEGRVILINTLRSAQLLIIKNLYSLILILGTLVLGLRFPFYPLGLFFLSFTNGTLPVLSILADKPKQQRTNYLREFYLFIVTGGMLAGIISLMLASLYRSSAPELMYSVLLSFLVISGMINYMVTINDSFSLYKVLGLNKGTLISILVLVIYVGAMYIPPVQQFLKLGTLSANDWLSVLFAAGAYLLLFSGLSSLIRRLLTAKSPTTVATSGINR